MANMYSKDAEEPAAQLRKDRHKLYQHLTMLPQPDMLDRHPASLGRDSVDARDRANIDLEHL
jgi:hypothetical protein